MVAPLKIAFPKSREHLWVSSATGTAVDIFPLKGDKLELQLRTSTLRLAVHHCAENNSNCCFLLGSAQSNSEEEMVLFVDRFDPGVPTQSLDIGPTAVLDGDIPVRTNIVQHESEWREQLPYSEKELEEAVDTLSLLLSQSQQVSLDMFLTLQLSLHPVPSSGQILIRAGAVLSGGHLQLSPISPIPLLPTALARNLTGPTPIYQVQQRLRGGYLTMDESRRLLLLLDSDPKAPNFPVVGVWVGGATSVRDPAVWASCTQYVRTELLRDKAAVPVSGFLLLLYSQGAEPAFFQCCCSEEELLFSFLSSETLASLTQDETASCQLLAVSAPLLSTQLRARALSGCTKGQLSLFEDPPPHPSPHPTPVAALAFSKEDSLLNLSIIESVASRGEGGDKSSFCQQVTSSMLLPGPFPPPRLPLSPVSPPPPSRSATPCPLSAEETAALLREQQLKIEALQAQVEILMQQHSSPPPVSSLTVSSLDQTLPSIDPTDVPSFVSHETTRSSALREITPQLLALSPPEPELTISSSLCSGSLGEVYGRESRGRTQGDSIISGLESEREEEPVRLFTSEFIRENETHRELTARHLDSPDSTLPPLSPPLPPATSPLPPAPPLEDSSSFSSIYIPRIQYHALPREDSFVSLRDPSDHLALKYLEGRSILLDPSVQQLSFIQGAGRNRDRDRGTGINTLSAMSIDTRAYLERHNLVSERGGKTDRLHF